MRLALIFGLLCVSVAADKILVLHDSSTFKETHSIFLKSLTDRGHQLAIRLADEPSLNLIKHGQLVYDHLLVMAPSVDEFGGTLSAKEIASFVDQGGNVLVTGGANIGNAIRELALENGFEFDAADTSLIDHHNFDAVLDDGYHSTLIADKTQLIDAKIIVGDVSALNPILFKGSALIADSSNLLKLEILRAASTAYSTNPSKPLSEYPNAIGKSALMIGGVQARNNARVLFVGSLEMFSDAYINAVVTKAGLTEKPVKSGNLALITDLTKWVIKEKGVLRVKSVDHHKAGEKEKPTEYTIMEDVDYAIGVEELVDGKWQAFLGKDVQLEFVRIDPFVRTTLKNSKGVLSARFKLPDVYGVYKFLIDYRRIGYSHLYDVQQVSVRPLWHTQYERFIRSAHPYYASSFSMMAGVVLFAFVFLHFKEESPKTEGKKTK